MNLSVVVPAYNEARRIRSTVESVSAFCREHVDAWEILVVDDGSADDAAGALEGADGVRLLRNDVNRGKGFSVRRGMLEAGLDPVLFTDADLSTPIDEAVGLMQAIADGADLAIAVRTRRGGKVVKRTPHRRLMGAVFRLAVRTIVLRGFSDTQCGFKMFRRDAARRVFSRQRIERWGFDVEILYIARKLGLRIAEVPVSWQESSESRLKLTTPLTMLGDIIRVRWNDLRGMYRS